MRLRLVHLGAVLSILIGIVLTMLSVVVPSVGAAATTVFGPPHEGGKIILADTSVDGPSLWTSSTGSLRGLLGWTGTDAAHHLNVMTSSDGIHYGSKYILSDTSIARPAVVDMGSSLGDNVAVAWTGTDGARTVNLRAGTLSDGYTKATFWGETSFTAPTLAFSPANGDLYLAWAGTDRNHSLNVERIIPRGGISVDVKVTLSGASYASLSRPSLALDPNGNTFVLSWTGLYDGRIHFATSADGVKWSAASTIGEFSDVGPTMIGVPVSNMPRHFLAWRGTDAAHSLNVRYTETYPSWPLEGNQSTLSEQAYGGPALGFVGISRQEVLAWTGTDAAHHLNITTIDV